jgi:hypothetical protein
MIMNAHCVARKEKITAVTSASGAAGGDFGGVFWALRDPRRSAPTP